MEVCVCVLVLTYRVVCCPAGCVWVLHVVVLVVVLVAPRRRRSSSICVGVVRGLVLLMSRGCVCLWSTGCVWVWGGWVLGVGVCVCVCVCSGLLLGLLGVVVDLDQVGDVLELVLAKLGADGLIRTLCAHGCVGRIVYVVVEVPCSGWIRGSVSARGPRSAEHSP